jgi:hypothetical protein
VKGRGFAAVVSWARDPAAALEKRKMKAALGGTWTVLFDDMTRENITTDVFVKALCHYENEMESDPFPESGAPTASTKSGNDICSVLSPNSSFASRGVMVAVPEGAPWIPVDFRSGHRMKMQQSQKTCAKSQGGCGQRPQSFCTGCRGASKNGYSFCHMMGKRGCYYKHICEAYRKSGDASKEWNAHYKRWLAELDSKPKAATKSKTAHNKKTTSL